MKKSMKKLACFFMAFAMTCQTATTAIAAEVAGNESTDLETAQSSEISAEAEKAEDVTQNDVLSDVNWDTVLAPQMGWSSWNKFHQNISEIKMREVGQAMIDSKLNEFGYTYLNLDDCWQSSMRDDNGRMQFDLTNFPSGPKFIKDMNKLAGADSKHPLKVGVYSSCGDYTCEDLTASYKNEELDAQTFAEWGVEYLKYDYCHVVDMNVDSGYITAAPDLDYITVAKANQKESIRYEAEKAILAGNAAAAGGTLPADKWYVTGLNANGGSVTFEKINVPEAGTYVLTIGFYKSYSNKKFAEVVVNDTAKYETTIAQTSGWNNTGRQQLYIDLKAGDNTIKIHNPIGNQKDDSIRRYTKMGNALKTATAKVAKDTGKPEKPIFYSVCEHGRTEPWKWAQDFASSWRTSGDINNQWSTIVSKYDITKKLWSYQKPGAYNDPDMLEVGNGSLTYDENKAHFTLWSMMSSPLILGNDIRDFVKEDGSIDKEACNGAYDIVTNQQIIDLNQKKPMLQCKPVSKEGDTVDILVKPLDNNEVAVCFFNRGTTPTSVTYDLNGIKEDDARVTIAADAKAYKVVDLWDPDLTDTLVPSLLSSGEIPGHGVKVFKISAVTGDIDKLEMLSIKTESVVSTGDTFTVTANLKNIGTTALNNINITLEGPEGFTFSPVTGNTTTLNEGEMGDYTWTVTAPAAASKGSQLTASLTFNYGTETAVQTRKAASNITVMQAPTTEMWLGDMEWISATAGWSTVKRNQSIDGNKISIAGKQYEKGVGTHAVSEVKVYLGKKAYRFTAVVGIDDEMKAASAAALISFELLADGVKVYDSGNVKVGEAKEIDQVITDCTELTLRVTDGGNGIGSDHGDWANAKFEQTEIKEEHNITIVPATNGAITISAPNNAIADKGTLEIFFTSENGYRLDKAFVNGMEVNVTNGKYVMNNVRNDVIISAGFISVDTPVNIALTATASSPAATAENSGPELANDGLLNVSKNGFAIADTTAPENIYLQYNWTAGKDISSIEYSSSFAAVRAAEECKILISYDGTTFVDLATWSGLTWEKNENVIETQIYSLTEEQKTLAKNVKGIRILLTKPKFYWNATVIMEMAVMGTESAVKEVQ